MPVVRSALLTQSWDSKLADLERIQSRGGRAALRSTRSRISVAEISPASNRASCFRQYSDGCPPSMRLMATAFLTLLALASRSNWVFRVANLDQLDPRVRDLLLVFHVVVDANSMAGGTLPQLVADSR